MNITKKDLSVSIKEEFNLSGEQGSIIVDEFFASLSIAMKSNSMVKISGFGTFKKLYQFTPYSNYCGRGSIMDCR